MFDAFPFDEWSEEITTFWTFGVEGDTGTIILTILGGTALVWFVENIQGVAGGIIKSVVAALTAAVTALETGYFDGGISQGELLTAIGAFAATLAVTYQIPNATPETAAVVPTVEVGGTTQTPTRRGTA